MSQSDEINAQRASRYAWILPADFASIEEDEEQSAAASAEQSAPDASASPSLAETQQRARIDAEQSVQRIDALWQNRLPAAAALAELEALLLGTDTFGLGYLALNCDPALLRLARLAHRSWSVLSKEARDAALMAFFWIEFEHPEAVDLLIELARDGNLLLGQQISTKISLTKLDARGLRGLQIARLGPRLVDVLRRADALTNPQATRMLALDWLGLSLVSDAFPLLRGLLRMPHLGIRRRALDLLTLDVAQPQLAADDVRFLLTDLFMHPPTLHEPRLCEEEWQYARGVQQAVAIVRPPGGDDLLMRIISGDLGTRDLSYSDCDGQWALLTLAAAYPERALPSIDFQLSSFYSSQRLHGVDALARLPMELAEPRLRLAAGDGAPRVAERAKEVWLDRTGCVLNLEPLAGFPLQLLAEPPSARLADRLAVLRSPSAEVRQAMIAALLAEAPEREALALITFALADDQLLAVRHRRLPHDAKAMASRLHRCFGAPAVASLCWLAERYFEQAYADWTYVLGSLAEARRIPRRDLDPLRALLGKRIAAAASPGRALAWSTLAKIGAPSELREPLLMGHLSGNVDALYSETVLQEWPRDAEFDARIVELADAAWTARDACRLQRLAKLGFARKLPQLFDLAPQILDAWLIAHPADRSDDARFPSIGLAKICVMNLLERGKLPAHWILDALRAPESAACVLAASVVHRDSSLAERTALLALLHSSARDGETAEAAAMTLLSIDDFDVNDVHVFQIAARAPRALQPFMIVRLSLLGAPEAPMLPILRDYFGNVSAADGDAPERLLDVLESRYDPELLACFVRQIGDTMQRERLLERIRFEGADPYYWQDEVGTEG